MEKRGEQIPGSRYVRDFCAACEAPIRVAAVEQIISEDEPPVRITNHCNDCRETATRSDDRSRKGR